jgi:hypothetical protein
MTVSTPGPVYTNARGPGEKYVVFRPSADGGSYRIAAR